MSDRPSMYDRHMRTAFLWAERGSCSRTNSTGQRMQVGCVITSEDMTDIYGIGYNGNAHGLPNKCDTDIPGACGCIHAEENAVIKCGRRPEPKFVFTTHLPCMACAKRIINLKGVVKVWWAIPYRITTSLDVLKSVGIDNEQLELDQPPVGELGWLRTRVTELEKQLADAAREAAFGDRD